MKLNALFVIFAFISACKASEPVPSSNMQKTIALKDGESNVLLYPQIPEDLLIQLFVEFSPEDIPVLMFSSKTFFKIMNKRALFQFYLVKKL